MKRLGDVPSKGHWVFHLRRTCDVTGSTESRRYDVTTTSYSRVSITLIMRTKMKMMVSQMSTNVSIDDRLVNGQLGAIIDTKQDSSGILNKIQVKLESKNAGLTKMR